MGSISQFEEKAKTTDKENHFILSVVRINRCQIYPYIGLKIVCIYPHIGLIKGAFGQSPYPYTGHLLVIPLIQVRLREI
jgi:hypothetical protein